MISKVVPAVIFGPVFTPFPLDPVAFPLIFGQNTLGTPVELLDSGAFYGMMGGDRTHHHTRCWRAEPIGTTLTKLKETSDKVAIKEFADTAVQSAVQEAFSKKNMLYIVDAKDRMGKLLYDVVVQFIFGMLFCGQVFVVLP
jgi:hypothetical protein